MTVVETEVEGIPTLFAARDDGVCSAGLVFRVGGADEHLAVRGVTHLVEHLALRAAGLPAEHVRDGLSDLMTRFSATGTPDEVAAALTAVCAALRTPPIRHLDEERLAMHTEDLAREDAATRGSAMMRWGARGRGLTSYPEVGLAGLDPEIVAIWASAAFTSGNAVLWVSGEGVPRGLDLALPEGDLPPLPTVAPVLPRTPAWFAVPDTDTVHVTGLVPRCAATDVYAHLLDRSLREDLAGLVTSVRAHASAHDAHTAMVTVDAHGRPEAREALGGAVVDALARVRWGRLGVTDRAAVGEALLAADRPDHEPDLLAGRAADRLLGRTTPLREQRLADLRAVSADDVRDVAESFHGSALAQVPVGGLDWAGFSPTPSGSSAAIDGREHPVRGGGRAVLVVGTDGVSLRSAAGVVTVRYRELAAMESFADGGRWLVGQDGFRVHVEPTVYEIDAADVARIDEAVDAARIVHLAARPEDRLPRPADPRTAAAPRRRLPRIPRVRGRADRS